MAIFLVLFAAGLILNWASWAQAHVIELYSGEKVEGKLLKEEKDSVLMDVGIDTPVTYFRDEIKSITEGDISQVPADKEAGAQADDMEAKAVELIDDGKMTQGIELFRQAVVASPTPQRRLNYGSLLFGNGVEAIKRGLQEQGQTVLREAEAELKKAAQGFDPATSALFAAQAWFLLGEIYSNAFSDPVQAQSCYQKAVDIADHEGAKSALQKLSATPSS